MPYRPIIIGRHRVIKRVPRRVHWPFASLRHAMSRRHATIFRISIPYSDLDFTIERFRFFRIRIRRILMGNHFDFQSKSHLEIHIGTNTPSGPIDESNWQLKRKQMNNLWVEDGQTYSERAMLAVCQGKKYECCVFGIPLGVVATKFRTVFLW